MKSWKTIGWRVLRNGAALAVAAVLAACGGGGGAAGTPINGGGSGGGGGGGGGTTPPATIAVTLSSSSISPELPAVVTATVKTTAGTAVAGQVVTFTAPEGLGRVSAETALTDANGQAQVSLSPATGATVGAGVVTAKTTVTGTEVTGQASFQISAAAPATIQVQLGTTTLQGNSSTSVTATLRTLSGTAVPNALVNFTTLNGRGVLSATSALTNSAGQATVTLTASSTASSGADTVNALASVNGLDVSASANFQFGGASAGTLTLTLPSQTLQLGQKSVATATVRNAAGAPISGVLVRFSDASGLLSFSRTSELTSSTGIAQVEVSPQDARSLGAGALQATATIAGLQVSTTTNFSIDSSAPATIAVVPPSEAVTFQLAREAVVQVQSRTGAPIANQLVRFTSVLGLGKPSKASELTDAFGVARVQLSASSNTASGADQLLVQATVNGIDVSSSATFRVNASATGFMTIGLENAQGQPVDTVTSGSPATVRVRLFNDAGVPIPGAVISFRSLLGFGVFTAPTALTNSAGIASVQLSPATATTTGADTVTASTTLNGTNLTSGAGFQLRATNVDIASFTPDPVALSAYGQSALRVVLSGTSPNSPVSVVINSTCIGEGKASVTPATVTTTTGEAIFTYRDNGCGAVRGSDTVQASVSGTTLTATRSLQLSSPAVSAINFISATPSTIFLRGSGYTENSTIKFQVKDANGNGLPQQSVRLEASTLAGGLKLDDGSDPVTKITDANGDVLVRVNSGTVPTPVRIRATLLQGGVATGISTVSSNLSVAVGLPTQLSFSMAQETINIEGYNIDGTPNTYTITASDRLSNPVPDGTAINFVSEGGQIQPTRFTQVTNGISRTTTNFVSAEPRPRDGRLTVLAYALGEKSFLDLNGNNQFDAGEPFQDLGDVFIDRLFNVRYSNSDPFNQFLGGFNQVEDQVISLTLPNTSLGACQTTSSPLLALNSSVPALNTGTRCTTGMAAYVRRAVQTVLSTSSASPTWGTSIPTSVNGFKAISCPAKRTLLTGYDENDIPTQVGVHVLSGSSFNISGKSGGFSFFVSDANPIAFNPVAAGSVVTATGTDGLSVTVVAGTPVPSTSTPNGAALTFKFDDQTSSGTVFVNVRSPSGLTTTSSVFLASLSSAAFAAASEASCP